MVRGELAAELVTYIQASIVRGGSSSAGRSVQSALDHAVYEAIRRATGKAAPRPIKNIKDLIFNMVNAAVAKTLSVSKVHVERSFGTLLVTNSDVNKGWLQEEQKIVSYETKQAVYTGEEVNYRRERNKYVLEKAFTGAMKRQHSQNYADDSNAFVRFAGDADFAQLEFDFTQGEADWASGGSASVPAGEQVWFQDEDTFAYFNGSVYTEQSGYPGDPDFTVDCSAYFSAASAGVPVTNGDWSYTMYPGTTRAMKVLFYGKYRICLISRFYYTENDGEANDWTESGVSELIIIDSDIDNGSAAPVVLFTKLLSHTPWSSLVCPKCFYGGYVDIKVNQENGKLLLLTGGSPTTTTIAVKYYNEADPVTDPQIYDHTTNATVYRAPFDLDEVIINFEETDFELVQNLYSHNGVVSSVDGISVVGGITSCMFTQQPESFDIYLNRHMNVYKQMDAVPVTADDVRWAYQLLSYGRFEFYDVTLDAVSIAPETYKTHSTACGGDTTTGKLDKSVAVVDTQPLWSDGSGVKKSARFFFIEEWLPGTDRHAVVNEEKFYECGGANITGRPDKQNPYYTWTGSSTITRTYDESSEGSLLHEDRFLALTDGSLKKYLWFTKVEIHYWFLNDTPIADTKNFDYYQEQGYTFWRNDVEALEMTLLDAVGIDKSQRYNGGFVSKTDATLIEYTFGYNNGATYQMTDDTVLIGISRAERVQYLERYDNWNTRKPPEVHYDHYVLVIQAMLSGLTGAVFQGSTEESHDLVAVGQLDLMEVRRALVALALA